MTVDLGRYTTQEDKKKKVVALMCSDCGEIARWKMMGPWPIAVEQRKYQHAERFHGEWEE